MEELLRWIAPTTQADLVHFITQSMLRVVLAAFLGGLIGVERGMHHKPAGLRTNMFICIGAAMFTVLSGALAGSLGGDHTRVAAQIIPGIGFIGAGSILHDRRGVTGLTTAATIFVVASIGMAAGGGQTLLAIFGTALVLLCLIPLGYFEVRWTPEEVAMTYDLRGSDANAMMEAVNTTLRYEERRIDDIRFSIAAGEARILVTVEATIPGHERILQKFRTSPQIANTAATRKSVQEFEI